MSYSVGAIFTPAAAATDIFEILNPALVNATDIDCPVLVKSLRISGVATATIVTPVLCIKRLVADTAGTSTTIVPTCWDFRDTDGRYPRGRAKTYTANPTVGTSGGNISAHYVLLSPASGATNILPQEMLDDANGEDGSADEDYTGVLLHSGESLVLNLNGATIAGNSVAVTAICEDLVTLR